MRLASYNVENLFERPRAFAHDLTAGDNPVLDRHSEVNRLLSAARYDAATRDRIARLLIELRLERSDEGTGDVLLRKNRGKLLRRPRGGGIEIVAGGRADWNGWVELKVEVVGEMTMRNTARVIAEVGADVQAIVEAESRPALLAFAKTLVRPRGGERFQRTMLIDGNDDRGIDVGILMRNGWRIAEMRSHVDDRDGTSEIFSRDCPEYLLTDGDGGRLVVLVNHLKSQIGNRAANDRRRRRQCEQIRDIYRRLRDAGHDHVAVVGDFNADPADGSVAPLVAETDLRDAADGPAFDDGGLSGTYGSTGKVKFDYILLSPALFRRMRRGGIFRKGVWNSGNGAWQTFDTLTRESEAASDHAAVWVDLEL